ncbi:unnamed protein product [Trichogramma brassicae]|uniref:Uncharacterized protein n=1 Tax=Trichogramma brassicae TaxID=86971 RepID=A0A6H5ICH9_9HYME|nr:unnamed protein product [Trichogramma brassicae]
MCDDKSKTLELDARDKLGRTPLQLAVVHSLPHAVDVLLARGADIASFFEFPTAAYFVERFESPSSSIASKLASVSRVLAVVRNLEKTGFKLDQSDALIIMNYFDWCRLLDKPADFEENWYQKEEFGEKAFSLVINSWLSLLDLIQLKPKDAENLVNYKDYCELSRSEEFSKLPVKYVEACVWHLCDTMSSGFFQRYALEPLREQMHQRVRIRCCEKILEQLKNHFRPSVRYQLLMCK